MDKSTNQKIHPRDLCRSAPEVSHPNRSIISVKRSCQEPPEDANHSYQGRFRTKEEESLSGAELACICLPGTRSHANQVFRLLHQL